MPRPGKGFGFARDFVIDHAVAGVDRRAAEPFLGFLVIGRAVLVGLAQAIDHGRPGGEDLAEALDHDRIVARHSACRAEACGRPERERDHRHSVEIGHHIAPAGHGGDIGRADLFQCLHRAAAARAVDHADDRELELMRHHLGLHHLARNPRIRRAAANGEVVRRGDHRAAIDQRLAEQERGGGDAGEVAVGVIPGGTCDLADFAEGAFVA
jgi:hypothetical protein